MRIGYDKLVELTAKARNIAAFADKMEDSKLASEIITDAKSLAKELGFNEREFNQATIDLYLKNLHAEKQ